MCRVRLNNYFIISVLNIFNSSLPSHAFARLTTERVILHAEQRISARIEFIPKTRKGSKKLKRVPQRVKSIKKSQIG